MRLTVIILLPLLGVATLVGLWQVNNARNTAAVVFDRSLLSAAIAVTNDVANSGGDALSARTRDILSDTSGGRVFYHVYGPDGVIVAGYATPPVGVPRAQAEETGPTNFKAIYHGNTVSGVRLQNRTQVDGFAGVFTTTVWQDNAVRNAFVRDLVMRSLITIAGLIASLALIVWFGVRLGLRPLLDLQNAIERRSSDELSPIQRAVPTEVEGIVQTLNRLFRQVSQSMTAQSEFISNAAHQLRNPIAGVLSLAEAVKNAPTLEASKSRSADLLAAAQETADLSQKLLLLERAKSLSPLSARRIVDLDVALAEWIETERAEATGVAIIENIQAPGQLNCDPTMLREALRNLIDNALTHGGPLLSQITVTADREPDCVVITVTDNGQGIPGDQMLTATARFQQLSPESGSGLGLSIVETIVAGHGGSMTLFDGAPGLGVEIRIPQ